MFGFVSALAVHFCDFCNFFLEAQARGEFEKLLDLQTLCDSLNLAVIVLSVFVFCFFFLCGRFYLVVICIDVCVIVVVFDRSWLLWSSCGHILFYYGGVAFRFDRMCPLVVILCRVAITFLSVCGSFACLW